MSATAHLAVCNCDQPGLLNLRDHRGVLAISAPADQAENSVTDKHAHGRDDQQREKLAENRIWMHPTTPSPAP